MKFDVPTPSHNLTVNVNHFFISETTQNLIINVNYFIVIEIKILKGIIVSLASKQNWLALQIQIISQINSFSKKGKYFISKSTAI